MKTVLSLTVLSFFLVVTGVLAQPKIDVVGGTQLDMGDVFQGHKAERVLTIKNTGKDTLKISDVHAQCGCTAAMMTDADKRLAPGQTGKLSISFNTSSYSGKVSKQVYVTSNDTSNTRLTVTFTTNVLNVLIFEPKMLSFDNMKLDSTYTKTVTITNPSSKVAVKIASADSKSPMLTITLMKNELMPGESTQMQAVYKATKTGTYQGQVEFTTDNQVQQKVNLSYYAWINRK
ncbi:MAG: DUF1573 domain-containing protein [Ignavibacteriae bacterium]|nr:DUF1573 domain-containing protein [Ignavibacteria bacterium]MBI3363604.1 DUF1573 domain-containing protein [Ignavibacteriota bacterium]